MPVPTIIPSTIKRTPLVKVLDPVKFSMSRVEDADSTSFYLDLISPGSIGQLAMLYSRSLSVAMKYLGMPYSQSSLQAVKDEIMRRSTPIASSASEAKKLGSAWISAQEAWKIKEKLLEVVASLASKDGTGTLRQVRAQVKDTILQAELVEAVNAVSRSQSRR